MVGHRQIGGADPGQGLFDQVARQPERATLNPRPAVEDPDAGRWRKRAWPGRPHRPVPLPITHSTRAEGEEISTARRTGRSAPRAESDAGARDPVHRAFGPGSIRPWRRTDPDGRAPREVHEASHTASRNRRTSGSATSAVRQTPYRRLRAADVSSASRAMAVPSSPVPVRYGPRTPHRRHDRTGGEPTAILSLPGGPFGRRPR